MGVIAAGRIRAVDAPAELGGRATAKATVSWLAPDGRRSVQTDTPTRAVAELAGRFSGEIPELTVTRPSLEDIYLSMIGHAQDGAAEGLPGRSPGTVVVGLAFSIVFGTWVAKIIEQSRERAQLISRLEAAQAELAQLSPSRTAPPR